MSAALKSQPKEFVAVTQPAGGSFFVFQFTTRVLPDLRRFFGYVKRKFEPLNVLPAHLFFCQPATA